MSGKLDEIFNFIKKDFEKMKESSKENKTELEEDKSEFIYQLGDKLITRSQNFDEFTECEKVFYCCKTFNDEVLSSGNFYSVYTSYIGEYVYDIVKYFELLGSIELSKIIKKANAVFPKKLPKDRDKRDEYVSSIYEKIENELEACCEEYQEYSDLIDDLLYEFAIKNKNEFKDYER